MTADEKAKHFQHDDIVKMIVSHDGLVSRVSTLEQRNSALQRQLDWYKKQIFGSKSEKRFIDGDHRQMPLTLDNPNIATPISPILTETITYQRQKGPKQRDESMVTDEGLRFDADVPVKEITLRPKEMDGLSPDQYTIIRDDVTYRLAQRPGSVVVLKYTTPVIKLKETQRVRLDCDREASHNLNRLLDESGGLL